MLELILYFGPVILVVLLVLLIITQGYVKAPPDHAYIISGLRKEPRVLVGRAGRFLKCLLPERSRGEVRLLHRRIYRYDAVRRKISAD